MFWAAIEGGRATDCTLGPEKRDVESKEADSLVLPLHPLGVAAYKFIDSFIIHLLF